MALRWHVKDHRIWERGAWEPDTGSFHRISRDGDVGALYYSNLGRIGHTFMIRGEDKDYFLSVEGNTSSGGSRDGDGVYLRKRLKKSVYCVSRWDW